MDPMNYHIGHLAEEMRCSDWIQLLEGPTLLPCPWPVFAASVGKIGFVEFLLEVPENEVDGRYASFAIYKRNFYPRVMKI